MSDGAVINPGCVYTIGHGGRTMDQLISELSNHNVQFVIDVRSAPYSRYQPEFSKKPLERILIQHKVKYVFMGDDLGGRPKDSECYTNGTVDYSKCRTRDFFRRGIERVRNAYQQGYRVCLLCSEGKPWKCHRSRLIGAALQDQGIDVRHILPDGTVCTQDDMIRKLTGGQGDLFGADL